MDADGGASKYKTNKAGAKYGTGYCDAKCTQSLKFVNGLANIEGWIPSATDPVAGAGNIGSCCSEIDIWQANSISTALTAHPCETVGQHVCIGAECGGTFSGDPFRRKCDYDGKFHISIPLDFPSCSFLIKCAFQRLRLQPLPPGQQNFLRTWHDC